MVHLTETLYETDFNQWLVGDGTIKPTVHRLRATA